MKDEIIIEKKVDDLNEIQIEIDENVLFPRVENLNITPNKKQQVFTHPKTYGYDVVTVGAMEVLSEKDINFYDYNGELLYTYTFEEFNVLTELPPLPEHKGLICQEWNWDLEDIKEQQTKIDVGPNYITDDGKTRIYIEIPSEGRKTLSLYYYIRNFGEGIEIDWGDGSDIIVETSTFGRKTYSHTYAQKGNYIITFNLASGAEITLGHGSNSSGSDGIAGIVGNFAWDKPSCYKDMVKKIELGNGIKQINDYDFKQLFSLETITIPTAVQVIGDSAFTQCGNLKAITIPKGITALNAYVFSHCGNLEKIFIPKTLYSLGYYGFRYCSKIKINLPNTVTSLNGYCFEGASIDNSILKESMLGVTYGLFKQCAIKAVNIPDNYTSIGGEAFENCEKLTAVIFPESLTNIGSEAFSNCYSLGLLDFSKCKQIPQLYSYDVFYNLPTDCKIYVPVTLYNEWKTATNWTRYANQIIAV